VLDKARAVFGQTHLRTRLARSTLADALVAQGSVSLAVPHYEQALQDAAATLGDDHPECLLTQGRLIAALGAVGEHRRAQELLQRFVDVAMPVLPAGHPDALAAVKALSADLTRLGLPAGQLAPLLEQVLQARLREVGLGHDESVAALLELLRVRSEADSGGSTISSRVTALEAARAMQGDAVRRAAALLIAHHELVSQLRQLGHLAAASQAESDALADLKAVRASLRST
jgi:hypothetical protein